MVVMEGGGVEGGDGITSKSEQNLVFMLILFFEKISKLPKINLEPAKCSQ